MGDGFVLGRGIPLYQNGADTRKRPDQRRFSGATDSHPPHCPSDPDPPKKRLAKETKPTPKRDRLIALVKASRDAE